MMGVTNIVVKCDRAISLGALDVGYTYIELRPVHNHASSIRVYSDEYPKIYTQAKALPPNCLFDIYLKIITKQVERAECTKHEFILGVDIQYIFDIRLVL